MPLEPPGLGGLLLLPTLDPKLRATETGTEAGSRVELGSCTAGRAGTVPGHAAPAAPLSLSAERHTLAPRHDGGGRAPYLGDTDRKVKPGSGTGPFPLDPGYRWRCLCHVGDGVEGLWPGGAAHWSPTPRPRCAILPALPLPGTSAGTRDPGTYC